MFLRSRRAVLLSIAGLVTSAGIGMKPRPTKAASPTSPSSSSADHEMDQEVTSPLAPLHPPQPNPQYNAWVLQALHEINSVRWGMTRADLERLFTPWGGFTSGGMFTPSGEPYTGFVYAYKECLHFKVAVHFRMIYPPQLAIFEGFEQEILKEDPKDVITRISQPFLD